MNRRPALWLLCFVLLTIAVLVLIAVKTIRIDPFFHYHKPDTDEYYYVLDNERSQNDGIVRHFEYSGIIAGTSMIQNFKASEAESLWGYPFIKVPSSGASFYEVNNLLDTALQCNPQIKTVIRSLDMSKFMDDKDKLTAESGEYTYLYDRNVINDVKYVLNRDVVFSRVYAMIRAKGRDGFTGGITSFDDYSKWDDEDYVFGKNALFPDGISAAEPGEPVHLTEQEAGTVRDNIRQNVAELAGRYPDVVFYCFITPYSAKYWMEKLMDGTICQQIEAEQIVIEELLACDNIRLFSFNNMYDITTDLNNYKDEAHYGGWINSFMLQSMYDDQCRITKENHDAYLHDELDFYTAYHYEELNGQPDYENDQDEALKQTGTESITN